MDREHTMSPEEFEAESQRQRERIQSFTGEPHPPFTDRFVFTGPNVAVGCDVIFDRDMECYVARSGSGHVGTGDTTHVAALMCFMAWNTNMHAYYQPPEELGGGKV